MSGPGQVLEREVLPRNQEASSIQVKKNEIVLEIDHFSFRIVAFLKRLFTGRSADVKIALYPILPTCMPRSRKVELRLYVFKATTGMREV